MSKILQLNVTANWGSTGKIADGIGLTAMSHGWESYIAYGRYMNPSKSQLIKVGNKWDVYKHYAKNRFLDGEGLGSKTPTKQLIKKIQDIEPDIVHLHNIHDHWLNYPDLFEYLATTNTPIVWTFHDCWAFTGGCSHFENISCMKWVNKSCSGLCPLSHKNALKNYNTRLNAFAPIGSKFHVVTVSNWLANYVKESMFHKLGASVSVINNGINISDVFYPTDQIKDSMILGVSNVWPEYKGFGDFIKLRQLLPETIKIVLVGLTKKQIKQLPDGISGVTRTSNANELADLYRTASVFVNPTYNDSFPTTNLEALACGTPVITYRTGGSPEAIDENTGIVVEKGDLQGLASSIMEVINNPQRYSSEACRERAVTHFNQDIQFGKYINLYDRLLSK